MRRQVEKTLCGIHGVESYPTIKLFSLKDGKKAASDYNGGRDAAGIVNFCQVPTSPSCARARYRAAGGRNPYRWGLGACWQRNRTAARCYVQHIPEVEGTQVQTRHLG